MNGLAADAGKTFTNDRCQSILPPFGGRDDRA
jgi:hypothetical protein